MLLFPSSRRYRLGVSPFTAIKLCLGVAWLQGLCNYCGAFYHDGLLLEVSKLSRFVIRARTGDSPRLCAARLDTATLLGECQAHKNRLTWPGYFFHRSPHVIFGGPLRGLLTRRIGHQTLFPTSAILFPPVGAKKTAASNENRTGFHARRRRVNLFSVLRAALSRPF